MATWGQLQFQDSVSPLMEEFCFFHDYVMVVLCYILTMVAYLLLCSFVNCSMNINLLDGQYLEGVWTSIPALILIQIATPSLFLLYSLEESSDYSMTLKILGHQWYWSYEYSDFMQEYEMDAYMENTSSQSLLRLLEADNRLVLPWLTTVRLNITSTDVLHAWAMPSMGLKADACPGRLNQVLFFSFQPGIYFGQCSEICGANHSFMPSVVEVISSDDFLKWLTSTL